MQYMSSEPHQTPTTPPSCDCHFHVFSAGRFAAGARYVPRYAASLNDWDRFREPSHIQRGVVVQPSFLGVDNRELLATLAVRQESLRGVGVVAESVTERDLRRLHANGVRGIRLNLMGVADDVQTLRDLPSSWWTAIMTAGLHLELHSDVARIAALLPHVPQALTVVLDHFAKPRAASLTDETFRMVNRRLNEKGQTFITLSGAYRQSEGNPMANERLAHLLARMWLEIAGRDRLLWGSDWPCTNHETQADRVSVSHTLDQWLPEANDRLAVLHVNPHRLYWR